MNVRAASKHFNSIVHGSVYTVAIDAALPREDCKVGEWGPWSECKSGLTKIEGEKSRPITDEERLSNRGRIRSHSHIHVGAYISCLLRLLLCFFFCITDR